MITQSLLATETSKTAALGSGTQNIFFGETESKIRKPVGVSLTPPLGRENSAQPLRGRDKVITEIVSYLESPDDPARVHILHGLGGSGKTSVALRVVSRAMELGYETWWLSGSDSASLSAGMQALAFTLGASEAEIAHGDLADVVWRRIENHPGKWLLVVDGADDPKILAGTTGVFSDGVGWVRPSVPRNGSLLITSREATSALWGSWAAFHAISMLNDEDGAAVLLDHTRGRGGDVGSAKSLSAALGGLPLALRIAGSYLAETSAIPWPNDQIPSTFSSYMRAVEIQLFPTLEASDPLVNTIWNLSLSLLERRGLTEARNIAVLLSSFADAPIPYQDVLDPAVLQESEIFESLDPLSLWRSLQALHNLSMIEMEVEDKTLHIAAAHAAPTVRMHPVVRNVALGDPAASATREAFQQVITNLLSKAMPGDTEDPDTWFDWALIAPHIFHNLDDGINVSAMPAGDLGGNAIFRQSSLAIDYLHERGFYEEARKRSNDLISALQNHMGETAWKTLEARHRLGHILLSSGKPELAETEHLAALTGTKNALGADDRRTINLWQCYAGMLSSRGKLEEAERELRAALRMAQTVLASDDSLILAIQHNLGHSLHNRGKYREAEKQHRLVLSLYDAMPNRSMQNREAALRIRRCYADIIMDRGKIDAAEREYREIILLQSEEVGEDDSSTLQTRHHLAVLLRKRGKYITAKAELEKLLEIRRRKFGEHHPSTLYERHYIADVMADLGDTQAAVSEHQKILQIEQSIYGEDHPSAIQTRFCLAWMLDLSEQPSASRIEFQATLGARTRVYGANHPTTLSARHSYAHFLEHNDDQEAAEAEHRAVLDAEIEVLGATHPTTLNTRLCLALLLRSMRKTGIAIGELNIVIAGRRKVLGVKHEDTKYAQMQLNRMLGRELSATKRRR